MNNLPNRDSTTYEEAFRDVVARYRRRRRVVGALKRLDPRPTSPGQVALIGLALVLAGWLVSGLHPAFVAGAILLAVAFLTSLMQPRSRRVVWRNRPIDLPPDETWATRLYRILYRSR